MTRLGNLQLDAPFFQAGLAGYSDAAMRLVARRHGAAYAVTEAMLDLFLIRGGKGRRAAELDPQDHPIAGQIIGCDPQTMGQAAAILADMGYDVIDVNLACPVKKVRKRHRGGHLLRNPGLAADILQAVRQAVPASIPCTLKLRRSFDDTPQAQADFYTIFEAAMATGYAAATVHGRSVEQKYLGPSRWSFLADLTRRYATHAGMAIFGSGDIWTAADIFRMIRQTNVQAVSVARGCIGNPWLFTQARALLAGDEAGGLRPPSLSQQRAVLLEHFELSSRLHGQRMASMMMRKFGIKFARHHPDCDQVAQAFIAVKSLPDWQAVLDRFYPHLDGLAA